MSVPLRCFDFVNHEIWVATDLPPVTPFGAWAEAGLKYGLEERSQSCNFLVKFWGEYNTNYQAAVHIAGPANLNTNYNAKISHSGSGSWGVYFDGTNVGGTSHSHSTTVKEFEVGGETTTSAALLTATATNLQKRSTTNTWSYGWGGAVKYDGPSNPFIASFPSTTSMSVSAN